MSCPSEEERPALPEPGSAASTAGQSGASPSHSPGDHCDHLPGRPAGTPSPSGERRVEALALLPACPEPLETSQAVLLLLRDMTRGTPPGRTPGLSLGTRSLLPAPRHGSADQYAFLLPTSWPPTRMPRMRGAVSLSMEHPTHGHRAWPRMHRLRQKPSLQKVVTCPPWEQRGHA